MPPFSDAALDPRAARAGAHGCSGRCRRARASRPSGGRRPKRTPRELVIGHLPESAGRARRNDPSCAPAPAEFGNHLLDDEFEGSVATSNRPGCTCEHAECAPANTGVPIFGAVGLSKGVCLARSREVRTRRVDNPPGKRAARWSHGLQDHGAVSNRGLAAQRSDGLRRIVQPNSQLRISSTRERTPAFPFGRHARSFEK